MATGLMLKKLVLRNLLSFGPEGVELELGPLNVLIGPNASGKSNLIDAIRLLAACPRDFREPVVKGGGFQSWKHQGASKSKTLTLSAFFQVDFSTPGLLLRSADVNHTLGISLSGSNIEIRESMWAKPSDDKLGKVFLRTSYPRVFIGHDIFHEPEEWTIEPEPRTFVNQSVLSYLQALPDLPEVAAMSQFWKDTRAYIDVNVSRQAEIRQMQPADADHRYLNENASNLVLVLNNLDNSPLASKRILEEMRRFNPRATGIKTPVWYGQVGGFVEEEGLEENVPFTRLSDGTLRWLCLLTVLLHPEPPSLICLEEPELGLHPDMIPRLAELLVEASSRTQLVVTTHSEMLVSALSDHPESIVVCEHLGGSTEFRRINPDHLREYIADYRLGDAWLRGEIGGTRY